jgi:hypothetical protein
VDTDKDDLRIDENALEQLTLTTRTIAFTVPTFTDKDNVTISYAKRKDQ